MSHWGLEKQKVPEPQDQTGPLDCYLNTLTELFGLVEATNVCMMYTCGKKVIFQPILLSSSVVHEQDVTDLNPTLSEIVNY